MALLAVPIAACQQGPAPAGAETSAAATEATGPEAKPGLSLGGGRLVLPAVKGNPGAAYFTLANNSPKAVSIAAVDVAGAGMAMLHETMDKDGHSQMLDLSAPDVKPGETIAFAPGGKHVMVSDLPASAVPGSTIELTLTFADGDKLSAPLTVERPGGN
jgi:copper(I)-binding protein